MRESLAIAGTATLKNEMTTGRLRDMNLSGQTVKSNSAEQSTDSELQVTLGFRRCALRAWREPPVLVLVWVHVWLRFGL